MDARKADLRERAREFAVLVIRACGEMGAKPGARDIASQVIRSGSSIGANIAEARGAVSDVEFAKFFRTSLKSANETVYWLELLRDAHLLTGERIEPLLDEARQLAKMLAAAVMKLKARTSLRA